MVLKALSLMIILAFRLCLGGIFFWSGLIKISDINLFAKTVRAYDMLPLIFVNIFAIVIPWVELLIGGLIIIGFWTRGNALIALFLLLSFAIAIGVNIFRGTNISCGCFGLESFGGSLHEALIRDIILIIVALCLLLFRQIPLSLDSLLFSRKILFRSTLFGNISECVRRDIGI